MWELDHKESWVPKNWCFWIVVLEKILESPLDFREIKPVNLKGNQSSTVIGRTDAEAPILWPTDAKNWFAGKDWWPEEKGTTEDEMVGWHHRLNRHRFGWTPGAGDGQGGLAGFGSWGHKESDMTEQPNWAELIQFSQHHLLKRLSFSHCIFSVSCKLIGCACIGFFLSSLLCSIVQYVCFCTCTTLF